MPAEGKIILNDNYILSSVNSRLSYTGEADQGDNFNYRNFEQRDKNSKGIHSTYHGIYPIYSFLFNLSNMGEVNSFDLIPFDWVAGRVNDYVSSMTGDFYEEGNNLEWLEVNEIFFTYCFLSDFIYVEWEAEEKKYNLYFKTSGPSDDVHEDLKADPDCWFVNILNGQSVNFKNPEEFLIRCSWNGKLDDRFGKWFRLAYDMEVKTKIIDTQFMLWNKRMFLDVKNNETVTAEDIDLFNKELLNTCPYLHKRTPDGFINYVPNTVASPTELDTMQNVMYKKFDREAGNMGLVPNLNPKQERLIVAEAHVSMDKQIDELRRRERQLMLMCSKMEALGWPPLKFVVNTAENLGLVVQSTPAASETGQNTEAKESQESNKNA